MKSTEEILTTIGCHHKYQVILSIIYLFIGTFVDFSLGNLSIMATLPKVEYVDIKTQKTIVETINEGICNTYKNKYEIVDSSPNNWVISLGYECQFNYVTILSSSFLFGNLLGLISLQFLKDLSKETSVKYLSCIYAFSVLLILFENFYTVFFFNLLQGFCQLSLFLLRNSIITEILCKKYRALFLNFQIVSSLTSALYISLMLYTRFYWKYQYYIGSGVIFAFSILNFLFIVTNPRYLLINDQVELATFSAEYIKKINGIEGEVVIEDTSSESEKSTVVVKEKDKEKDNDRDISTKLKSGSKHKSKHSRLEEYLDPNNSILILPESSKISHGYEQEPSLLFRFTLLILFICCSVNTIFCAYESKDFNGEEGIELYIIISTVASLVLFTIAGFFMNIKLFGRKYTLVTIVSVNIVLRLFYIITQIKNTYIYFIIRIFTITSQIPQHTLISESFSNKGRVKQYSILYIIVKICCIAVPVVYDNTSYLVYNIISISLSGICIIVVVFFIQETRGKELKDY